MALNNLMQLSTHTEYSPASKCRDIVEAPLLLNGDAKSSNRWWKIDLLAVYKVRAISIITPRSNFPETEIYIKKLDNDSDNNM